MHCVTCLLNNCGIVICEMQNIVLCLEVNDWVHSSKRIVPGDEADYWVDKILNNSTSGLIQSLAAMNQIIQVYF